MGRIKKFDEFFRSSISEKDEDRDLLRDLENIGMKDKTYTKEMFRDAMNNVNFDAYIGAEINGDDFEMSFDKTGSDSGEVEAYYTGGITTDVDTSSLWADISAEVANIDYDDYDEDEDEDRYTLDDLEAAFDSVNWEGVGDGAAEDAYDDIEIDIDGRDQGGGRYDVEAEASIDSDVLEVRDEDLIDAILDNL